jgi:hypothetical protein
MQSDMKAPAATTLEKLFNCLYAIGKTMPLGMNIAAFPTTFHIISRTLPYSKRWTSGTTFNLKGNAVAESNTSG